MDLKALIKQYLQEAKLMQLATSLNNQPWICSVWFASDENLNIYWLSSTTRRHSKEVLKNDKVAGVIVLPQTPSDPPRGLQFQGTAKLLTDKKDVDKAMTVYAERIFKKEDIVKFMSNEEKPHRFYKIRINQFVLFDAVNFPEESRQELNL